VFDRCDRGRAHGEGANAQSGKTSRLQRSACILAAKGQMGLTAARAGDDLLQKVQKAGVQRVIAPAHPLIFSVGCKEKLFQVIAADGEKIDLFEKLVWCKGQRGGFKHGAHMNLFRQDVAQFDLTGLGPVQLAKAP